MNKQVKSRILKVRGVDPRKLRTWLWLYIFLKETLQKYEFRLKIISNQIQFPIEKLLI